MDIETESTRRELAKDAKRKASRLNDPGWKYAFYPMPKVNKDVVKCILCGNSNHGGINRFKQHLIGGYPDIVKCPKTTKDITKINDFVQNKKKMSKENVQNFEEDNGDDDVQEIPSTAASNTLPSLKSTAGSKGKAAAQPSNFKKPPSGSSKSIASMLMKTPEQVVEDRHRKGASQTTLENRLRTSEEKERVHMHIANFFYECGIPFNAANSRSYERYGCTLMSDGWTDRRGRSLINFLANSPEGTFFLGSVNISSESHDAQMLANLLESNIKEIGEKNIVQVVTDNGANYKLAGQILEIRMPTLFWTPCAAHCVDLMLEDIGKIPAFKKTINQARRCTTFIYRHEHVLDAMREKTNGRDLIRTGATRFATAFLILDSLQKITETIAFLVFYVGDCVDASLPLVQVLRVVDGDERPALAKIAAAIDYAKAEVKKKFGGGKMEIGNKVVKIIDDRWNIQMGKPLHGAFLFLNLGRYFELLENDPDYASRLREDFNDVLEKMIHTKKRNRLEHQRLNDLVYVQYNQKIVSRFKKRRELGRKFDSLVFEDLEWANEWVGIEDRFWEAVDIASGASESLEGRNFPTRARGGSTLTYTRRNTSSTQDQIDEEDEDNIPFDDEEVEDDYGVPPDGTLVRHKIRLMKKMKIIFLSMMRKWKMIMVSHPRRIPKEEMEMIPRWMIMMHDCVCLVNLTL
ncbi:uncharacterized protein LOC141696056 [Apium graveolens]|uniref:uncharacterized protein LOC141696056 n=1 Tax=Apium graveolens TaxID=4045 RepID=UPI003D7978B0